MGQCPCKLQPIQFQPKKVHIKMIIDIYKSYFKNQGIKLTSKMQGMDNID